MLIRLFRAYHPKKAYGFEKSQFAFEIPIQDLKIQSLGTDWKELSVQSYMYKKQIYPDSMIKFGILSTCDRSWFKMSQTGVSSRDDMMYGGADSVYCRMINTKWTDKKFSVKKFAFSGHIQLIIDLKLLERVGYGYNYDLYGTKTATPLISNPYMDRSNLIELTKKALSNDNEILIKHRVPKEYILGIWYKKLSTKTCL